MLAKQQKEKEEAQERAKEAEEAAKAEAAHKREMRALQKAQASRAASAQSAVASDAKMAELSGETVEAVMQQRHGRETSTLLSKQYADRTRKLRQLLESSEGELRLRLDEELSELESLGASPEEVEARRQQITAEHKAQQEEAESSLREQLEAKHARQQLTLRQRQLAEIAGALQKLTPHETLRRREAEEAAREAEELRRFEEEMESEKTTRLESIKKEKEELERKIREDNERALKQLEEDHERQLAEERRRAEEALARRRRAMDAEQDTVRKEAMEKAQHLDQKERERLLQQLEAERQQLEAKFEEQRRAHDEKLRARLERRAQRRREAAARKMQADLAKRQERLKREEEDLKARSHALHGVMSKRGSAALGSMAPRAGTRAALLRGRTGALGRGSALPGRRLTIGAKGAPSTEQLRSQLQGLKASGSMGRGMGGLLGKPAHQHSAGDADVLEKTGSLTDLDALAEPVDGASESRQKAAADAGAGAGASESKASNGMDEMTGLGEAIEEGDEKEESGESGGEEELTLDSNLGVTDPSYGTAAGSVDGGAGPHGGASAVTAAAMDSRTKAALKERLDRIEQLIRKVQSTPRRTGSSAAGGADEGESKAEDMQLATTTSSTRPLALLIPPTAPRGFSADDDESSESAELPAKHGDRGPLAVVLQDKDAEISELDPRQVVRLRFARRMAALLQNAPLEDDLEGRKSMKLGLIRRIVVATAFPKPADPALAAPGNDFMWLPEGL